MMPFEQKTTRSPGDKSTPSCLYCVLAQTQGKGVQGYFRHLVRRWYLDMDRDNRC